MQVKGHVTELTVCGQWRLVREIGCGAYGTVHLAIGPGSERAAVKVCRRDAIGDERYGRELRGAKLYSSIPPQEGLVRMRELVETEWGFYTVMDLADDEFEGLQEQSDSYRPKTLARVIEGEKALPLKECVSLALSLAKGLAALQLHHLLHRDIKPGNVIYVGGRPVLSDPGLVVEESEAASLVGTPGYVPPEKFTDAASDIYSLGLTPKAASFGRQIEDLDKGPAMEADAGAPHFPTWWRILNKATDPTPSRRYQSAKALLKDINTFRLTMSVASVKRSWLFYTAVGILLALVAGTYIYMVSRERIRLESEIESLKQMNADMDNKAKTAAQDAWEAMMRNALRQTFKGISEESLSAMVEEERKKTFGEKK
jgi:serine/threonine protein kinase